jgi:hypothetical protein
VLVRRLLLTAAACWWALEWVLDGREVEAEIAMMQPKIDQLDEGLKEKVRGALPPPPREQRTVLR